MASLGLNLYRLGFEISPIILNGGWAEGLPDALLPIVSLTESINFLSGILNGGADLSLDKFFAHYRVIPGGSLAMNTIGEYPFANQAVAANAVIAQPLAISLLMICPVQNEGGYATKLAIMSALQAAITQHVAQGGLFTVATPAFIYTNCILKSLRDVSGGETKQPQYNWQWDFEQPLVTDSQAQQAYSQLMRKMGLQTQLAGDPPPWSAITPAVGNTGTLAAVSTQPAATNLAGSLLPAPANGTLLSQAQGILGKLF